MYRAHEGEVLYRDVTSRVHKIEAIYDEVETLIPERVAAVRERILKAAEELSLKLDGERLEQEMIFYLEKLDINASIASILWIPLTANLTRARSSASSSRRWEGK